MKVLHVIDRLEPGGAERLFVSITRQLKQKGIEVGAMLFSAGGKLDKDLDSSLTLHELNRTQKFNPVTLFNANKICSHYNIVHTHLRHVHAYIRLAQWLFGGRYKLIMHDHSRISAQVPLRFKGLFRPQYYIGVNKEQTEWAVQLGVKQQHTFLLENRVILAAKKTVINGDLKRAMLVANFRRVKNIEFAVKLCMAMNWQLDIYGNITEPDYHNEVMKVIDNDERIKVIHGITDFADIYENYAIAMHTPHSETGPLVLLEFLAAGLPFIAYKSGAVADAIAPVLPQFFMSNHDTEAWQQRVEDILSDKELPGKMKQIFLKNFDSEDYIIKCLEIYKSVHS